MSMRIQACLFDMDGTLCHTEPLHFAALREVLDKHGRSIDKDFFECALAGQTTQEVFKRLFPELAESERNNLIEQKEYLFRVLARDLQPMAGVNRFMDDLARAGVAIGLVTNAPRIDVDYILRVLDMNVRFEVLIYASELPHPKPHPLAYLKALEAYNVNADEALVFEDSITGIASARAAGIDVIGLTTTLSADVLSQAGVIASINDFQDIRLAELVFGGDAIAISGRKSR